MQDFRMETFIEVCQCMNYTKAAELLHITQPAVSNHIHVLEKYYGKKLFHYEGKSLTLTQEGELLYQAALRMRHDEQRIEEDISALGNGRRQWRFGATLTIGEYVIPKALAGIVGTNPNLDIHMTVGNTSSLLNMLDEGEIDFAIVEGYFEKESYTYRMFRREPFVCVTGAQYSSEKEVRYTKDLLSETLITREEGSGTREVLERFLQEENYGVSDFKGQIEINNIHAVKQLAADNCGVAFLYRAAVEEELENKTLKEVKLEDFKLSHEFNFIYQKDSMFSEEYDEICNLFKAAGTISVNV